MKTKGTTRCLALPCGKKGWVGGWVGGGRVELLEKRQSTMRITFIASFLSALLAGITHRKYRPKTTQTAIRVSGLFSKFARVMFLKLILFGATKKLEPKVVKCVHRHWVLLMVVFGPT